MAKRRQRIVGGIPVWLIVAAAVAVAGGLCLAPAGGAQAGRQPATAPADDVPHMTLYALLLKGGVFMIPIAGCSMLGLAVIIERMVALRRVVVIPPGFLNGLKSVFRHTRDDRAAGLQYCRTHDCPIARIAAAGIARIHKGEEILERAIEDAGANEVAKLRRNLRMLYSVAAVAPMLGLLGTVWGMILAFQIAAAKGLGRAELLATGIYQALVTTLAGLVVAVPVLIFYYYFTGKIEMLVSQMNDASAELLEHYVGEEANFKIQ